MRATVPHPDVQAVLDERKAEDIPRFSTLSVNGARKLLTELWTPLEDPEPVVRDGTLRLTVLPVASQLVSGLSPVTIVTCGFDVLRDEGIKYAKRLNEAAVEVTHRHYDDFIHGFIGMLDDPELRQIREIIAEIARDLQQPSAG